MGDPKLFYGMACKEDWEFLDEPRLDDIADAVLDNDPDRLLALLQEVFGCDSLSQSLENAEDDENHGVSDRSSNAA